MGTVVWYSSATSIGRDSRRQIIADTASRHASIIRMIHTCALTSIMQVVAVCVGIAFYLTLIHAFLFIFYNIK